MSLISHRLFMPKLLLSENREVRHFSMDDRELSNLPDTAGMVRILQALAVVIQIPIALLEGSRSTTSISRPVPRFPPSPPRFTARFPGIPQRILFHPL